MTDDSSALANRRKKQALREEGEETQTKGRQPLPGGVPTAQTVAI